MNFSLILTAFYLTHWIVSWPYFISLPVPHPDLILSLGFLLTIFDITGLWGYFKCLKVFFTLGYPANGPLVSALVSALVFALENWLDIKQISKTSDETSAETSKKQADYVLKLHFAIKLWLGLLWLHGFKNRNNFHSVGHSNATYLRKLVKAITIWIGRFLLSSWLLDNEWIHFLPPWF